MHEPSVERTGRLQGDGCGRAVTAGRRQMPPPQDGRAGRDESVQGRRRVPGARRGGRRGVGRAQQRAVGGRGRGRVVRARGRQTHGVAARVHGRAAGGGAARRAARAPRAAQHAAGQAAQPAAAHAAGAAARQAAVVRVHHRAVPYTQRYYSYYR